MKLAFGNITVDQTSAAKTVTVKNSHPYAVSLSATIAGLQAPDFTISSGTTCGASLGGQQPVRRSVHVHSVGERRPLGYPDAERLKGSARCGGVDGFRYLTNRRTQKPVITQDRPLCERNVKGGDSDEMDATIV
jgi:hypothetical protein